MNATNPTAASVFPSRRIPLAIAWSCYGVLWLGGVVSQILWRHTPSGAAWTAPAFLFIAALVAILGAPEEWRAMAIAAAIGFAAEVLGVKTSIPFGYYRYSGVLGLGLLGVPLAIACAWLTLIVFVRQMQVPLRVAAVWMAAIDLIIEPMAANSLGYWAWGGTPFWYGAPWGNFLGWYLVSVAILFVIGRQPVSRNFVVFLLGILGQLFFVVLELVRGLFLPAAIGVALIAAGIARWRMLEPEPEVRLNLDADPGEPQAS